MSKFLRVAPALCVATLVVLPLASAANLGGTGWQLKGGSAWKVAGLKHSGEKFGSASLSFSGASGDVSGICSLTTYKNGQPQDTFPCTWTTPSVTSPRFSIVLDSKALADWISAGISSKVGLPVTATITSDTGAGVVNKKTTSMSVRVKVSGTIQEQGQLATHAFTLAMQGHGTIVP